MTCKLQPTVIAALITAVSISMTGCTSKQEPPKKESESPKKDTAKKAPSGESPAHWVAIDTLPLGLDKFEEKIPKDNPLTPPKVELGRHLYFDKRLSKDDTVACASCHAPDKGWSDGSPTSTGIGGQVGGRNAPTVINRRFSVAQFWDGRAKDLEDQALGPVQNPIEMGNTVENAVKTVKGIAGYKPYFERAFGDTEVTSDRIAKAIASFERTIVSGNSPYDKAEAGQKDAMSESATRGKALFLDRNKGRCSICHAGFNFTDELYHNIGVGMDDAEWEKNHIGRHAVTKEEKDKGAYKTPTLRQVADSGPYMHDGSLKTLEEVVEFYVKGGHKHPSLDKEMKPLTLTDQEKTDLVEFMKALSGEVTQVTAPVRLK